MFEPELAVALRKTWVEDQLQGTNEVALADLVLAHDDNAVARLDVNIGEVGEVNYLYS